MGLKITAVMLPITLDKGVKLEASFVARWSVNYRVHIATERRLPIQEQNCLLGIETMVPKKCAVQPTELYLTWSATVDGELVASGDAKANDSGYWGPDMGKDLGSIPALKGQQYNLLVDVERSSVELQKTNPRLIVEVATKDLRWTYVWIGLLFILGTFSAALAAILTLVAANKKIL